MTKYKEYNYGIALLRIWMCFEVVLCHFYMWEDTNILVSLLRHYSSLAVPVFMTLAFLYIDLNKMGDDKSMFVQRMKRLLIPHLLWSLAYFFVYWWLDAANDYSLGIHLGIKGLIGSILTGNVLNTAAWFQIDLIIVTLVMVCFVKAIRNDKSRSFRAKTNLNWKKVSEQCFFILLFLLAMVIEYSGCWYKVVNRFLYGNVFYWPVGRFVEMIPPAIIGYAMFRSRLISRMSDLIFVKRVVLIMLALLLLILCFRVDSWFTIKDDFMYSGIMKVIETSLSIVIASTIRLDYVGVTVKRLIGFFSAATMNIYFAHNMIGTVLYKTRLEQITHIKQGSFLGCIVIFMVSALIAGIISLIAKTIKRVIADNRGVYFD